MVRFTVILRSEVSSHLLMTIKKQTGLGILDIKNRIANRSPIQEFCRRNKDDMRRMKELIEELIRYKVDFCLFKLNVDYEEELSLEQLMNAFELSRQIAEDRERMDAISIEEDD
ncbi:hypothetical protein ACFQZE_19060 [Paenibacillus sp. GCM10027627]|uniref:hypothetical protein n=1 Tax=unclassified Paenibacillus TaxID=185978 RepID=UPI003636C67C